MGKISILGVLRLRAPSPVSRDRSVTRSAQDDDFVGGLTKNIQNKLALMGLRPGSSSYSQRRILKLAQARGKFLTPGDR
jgi:hypothetical protein